MKKIWQKSLASMVSVALCLTAFVGCLTVNAAAKYNGTITSAGKEITTEATEAQIDLVVSATVPDGAKGMAYIGLKANTTFGTFKNVEVIDGAAAVDLLSEDGNLGYAIGADGQFIIKAFDTDKGVTSFTVRLTFKNDVGALTAGDEYPVEVKYLGTSDIGAANMDEESFAFTTNVGKITVKSSHTHAWGAGVMTTMPTTTSDGVITYTCGCGVTKQEAFSVSGTTIAERPELTATEVGTVKVAYCARYYAAVFTGIVSNGGNLQSYGMLLTTDGTTPVFGEGTAKSLGEKTADNTLAANKSLIGYYVGMNFAQMGQTLTFRPYVKFTLGEQECYYYGDVYTKVFIDQIRSNTDEQSIALVSLYDNRTSATTTDTACTGDVVVEGDSNIVNRPEYTVFNMNTTKIAYCARYYAAVFTGIVSNGGNLQSYGMLLTTDGTTPVFGEGTAKSLGEKTADNTLAANKSLTGYYTGMNFAQMGQTLTFRPYVKYTDAEGKPCYVYGSAVSFVYIDVLNSLASDNSFTQELINYYNTYVK